jgi:glycosyltransferase involved in cell wall biosynthesis
MTIHQSASGSVINIAHLLDGRHFGGAEQMVLRLIGESVKQGIRASAICLSEGRLATFLRQSGLSFQVIPSSHRLDFKVLSPLEQFLKTENIDLIQAHTSRTHLLSRIIGSRTGIPNITTIQSPIALDDNRGMRRHPVRAWVERMGRRWTQHIVCVSSEEAERIRKEENVSPEMISWIPNGVPAPPEDVFQQRRKHLNHWLEQNGYPEDTFVIGMIAQLRPRKGPEVLIEAFDRFRKQIENGVLLMIGDCEFSSPGYLEKLEEAARKSFSSKDIHFTGFMENPWILAGGLDLCVLPSRFGEGLPLVLLEAMSYGVPLAVSDTAGNREIVIGAENGWIHAPGNAEILAEHMHEAATDGQRLEQYRRLGLNYFQKTYTLEKICSMHIQLYHDLLE